MKLNDIEKEMLSGNLGIPRKLAIEHQIKVGNFFDAKEMIEVSQAHIMADTEALGLSGVKFLEELASHPLNDRKVLIPTITDPRGADFLFYKKLKQNKKFISLEKRTIEAFKSLNVLMTDTCINYQVFMPPVFGEHLAFGDTGSSIYANSVLGARTNFEGGPSAIAASLTGRTPCYGFHLNKTREPSKKIQVSAQLNTYSDWGALGGIIGKEMQSYWDVPIIYGINEKPTSDQLKHFGAALASFGSTPLFHIKDITPESNHNLINNTKGYFKKYNNDDIKQFYLSYQPNDQKLDVVVFAAPQLSLDEMQRLSFLLDGQKIHNKITLIACTSPSIKILCDRNNITKTIEKAGGIVLEGVCFYNMHAKEIAEANGWNVLMSNSAKITNILGGYGYRTVLSTMEKCVLSACKGKIVN